ncbi:YqaE/Pmp3 family membrane protein [Segetibacter sp. 3557_3]|uniref:YqaE/Pmp3 family membrane protein n=1 Tax=Segetibacter sp. 3557_3 TaxID=2547429 RepID=UPI001A9D8031|nr:YqaE/Pmp3 family membrane protein [Segetibacter sp. 3557_3]
MKRNLLVFLIILVTGANAFSAFVTEKTSTQPEVSPNPKTETAVPGADAVKAAMKEFKSLSRHDRKERLRNVKAELAAQKAAKQSGAEPSTNTLLLVILALLLPPLAVYLHQGEINTKFWISLLLTLVFFLPGVIYALVVVLGEA